MSFRYTILFRACLSNNNEGGKKNEVIDPVQFQGGAAMFPCTYNSAHIFAGGGKETGGSI